MFSEQMSLRFIQEVYIKNDESNRQKVTGTKICYFFFRKCRTAGILAVNQNFT